MPVKGGRRHVERVSEEWASKIISRIGKAAKVIVHQELRGAIQIRKYASADDVRRGLAERLFDAGIPAELVQIILRHASLETTRKHYAKGAKIQKQAERLRRRLDLAERRERKRRRSESAD